MTSLNDILKARLWQWYGDKNRPAEWDGNVYGGGKISQRFWEYLIAIEMLDLTHGSLVFDIGGGSPKTGLSIFPRLLASAGIQVVVFDVNFGDLIDGSVENVRFEKMLADRDSLTAALARYKPTHLSCISVLEHASAEQQSSIFKAMNEKFDGEKAVFTMEFHEKEKLFEQQLTTESLSKAVSNLSRYYVNRLEKSPLHCVNALSEMSRLWFPIAIEFRKSPLAHF